ncbi:MAG TPA: hypothetical protein VKY26_02555 [Actinomycetota bacterium]|nr:hypothetical protein [Actinomycetota bacterium]
MNRNKMLLGLMAVLGLGDLALVPFMIHANTTTHGTPPAPAIVVSVLLGIITLAVLPGIRDGKRWARITGVVVRVVDLVSGLLGIGAHPSTLLAVTGGIVAVGSVAAVALLVVSARRPALA